MQRHLSLPARARVSLERRPYRGDLLGCRVERYIQGEGRVRKAWKPHPTTDDTCDAACCRGPFEAPHVDFGRLPRVSVKGDICGAGAATRPRA